MSERWWRMRSIAICSMVSTWCGSARSRTVALSSRESGGNNKGCKLPAPTLLMDKLRDRMIAKGAKPDDLIFLNTIGAVEGSLRAQAPNHR
jgi:hypothetical protein